MKRYITAESVTIGHPDKLCDYIADSILDETLKIDENARVACEVMASKGEITVAGEITVNGHLDYEGIVYEALLDAGYSTDIALHFNIHEQSADIKNGVDTSLEARGVEPHPAAEVELGAGDQGVVFGYACNETLELMPAPITAAHALTNRLEEVRIIKNDGILKPDGKAQVTYEYENGVPTRIDTVVVSSQHTEHISQEKLGAYILDNVIMPTIGDQIDDANILVNPSGRFVEGGPAADTGLTGRKLIVDSYGGGHHGGGAFSGKDATKVDRSGAYMARYIAKAIVKAGIADRCEVQIAYAIGVATPVGLDVDTYGGSGNDEKLIKICWEIFNCTPSAIIKRFGLRKPIFRETAVGGHFGGNYPWEEISEQDIESLKEAWQQA